MPPPVRAPGPAVDDDGVPGLVTQRLRLRGFRDEDRAPFAALNADPEVMEYLPAPLSLAESDALIGRIRAHFSEHGFGLWAVELRAVSGPGPLLGFVGLTRPTFAAHFTPCVDLGWRLARSHWGHGYATEAATAALRFGFERLGLDEIVALTVPENARSRRVMERLGMRRDPADDFDHPRLPEGHRLRRHVLYRRRRHLTAG